MVKLNLDLKGSGVDVNKTSGFEPYEGPTPTPGVYAAVVKAVSIRISQNGNPYFNVLFEFADQTTAEKQKFKGYPHWEKITPGDSDFQKERVGKLLFALTRGKKDPNKVNVAVDHDEVTSGGKVNKVGGFDPVGAQVRIIVQRGETYQDQPTLRLGDLFPWTDDWPTGDDLAEDEDVDEDEDEDIEVDEEEEEEVDDDEAEEEDEEDEDDEYEARAEELGEMSRIALKKVLKELDPDFRVLKSTSDEDLVEAILSAEFEDDEPPF